MDTIEGETYNILSPNLIENESSVNYKVKTWTNDVIESVKETVSNNKTWIFVALGAVGTCVLIYIVIKIRLFFRTLMTRPRYYDDYDHYHDDHNQNCRR